jgi:hypothetical protein
LEQVADRLRISRSSVVRMLREVREVESALPADRDGQPLWERPELEAAMVGVLARAAARGEWRAAAFLLSHRWPQRWGPQRLNGQSPDEWPDDDAGNPFAEIDELAERRRRRQP